MSKPEAFAFFDFDGTLIPGDSIATYVVFARKRGSMPLGAFLWSLLAAAGYGLRIVSAADSKNAALRFRTRLKEKDRLALDEAFVRECLLPRVYPMGKARLEENRRAGRTPVLVTASTDNYMRLTARALNVPVLLATPLGADGRVGKNCKGEEKTRRIREWLREQGREADFSLCWAYGDSKSDLPMLRLCGHPVAVNAKKALRKAAADIPLETWTRQGPR